LVDVGSSSQPQKKPGVLHSSAVLLVLVVLGLAWVVDVGSAQPHHPGVSQVVLDVCVLVGVWGCVVVCCKVVVVLSRQPNQPGVLHVDVELVVVVLVLVTVPDEVVVSSRHPHHPGVLQVSVRVLERVEVVVAVVLSLLCPSTSFHNGQS